MRDNHIFFLGHFVTLAHLGSLFLRFPLAKQKAPSLKKKNKTKENNKQNINCHMPNLSQNNDFKSIKSIIFKVKKKNPCDC